MKSFLFYSCFLLLLQQSHAQYTLIPDPNFEQALIDLGIDSEGILDGQFLTADAENIAFLNVDNRNINDLTGIEAFINLQWLKAHDNNISEIDLSLITSSVIWYLNLSNNNLTAINLQQIPNIVNVYLSNNNFTYIDASFFTQLYILSLNNNPLVEIDLNSTHIQVLGLRNTPLTTIDLSIVTSLQEINLHDSQIQTLDFTNNQNLEKVYAYNTPLSSINLPNNPNVELLRISNTFLNELDITNCPNLIELSCSQNSLTQLDLTQNTNLDFLSCSYNQLTSLDLTQNNLITEILIGNNLIGAELDLSNNINLLDLNCSNNPIENIIGISNCTNLENIGCEETLLQEIDLSSNFNLQIVNFYTNLNLEFVNMQNGNNDDLSLFIGTNCPQLTCVVVDDINASNDNILIDENTTLVGSVQECEDLSIIDNNLKNYLNFYPNPVINNLYIENHTNVALKKITIYNILGKEVLVETKEFNILNVENLKNGVYFVKTDTNKGVLVKKIMKK